MQVSISQNSLTTWRPSSTKKQASSSYWYRTTNDTEFTPFMKIVLIVNVLDYWLYYGPVQSGLQRKGRVVREAAEAGATPFQVAEDFRGWVDADVAPNPRHQFEQLLWQNITLLYSSPIRWLLTLEVRHIHFSKKREDGSHSCLCSSHHEVSSDCLVTQHNGRNIVIF